MSYYIQISRAIAWYQAPRYPVTAAELTGLTTREADLAWDPDEPVRPSGVRTLLWRPGDREPEWLELRDGALRTNHPDDALLHRMLRIAAALDAWVVGEGSEVYYERGGALGQRQPHLVEIPSQPYVITRGDGDWLPDPAEGFTRDEWLAVVAAQADFELRTRVTVRLPSGLRELPCEPLAYWLGHPGGGGRPFHFVRGHVEVDRPDPATRARMLELAPLLGAAVRHDRELVTAAYSS